VGGGVAGVPGNTIYGAGYRASVWGIST